MVRRHSRPTHVAPPNKKGPDRKMGLRKSYGLSAGCWLPLFRHKLRRKRRVRVHQISAGRPPSPTRGREPTSQIMQGGEAMIIIAGTRHVAQNLP